MGWRHHREWLRKEVDKGEIERPRVTAAEQPGEEPNPRFEVLMSDVGGPRPDLMNIGEDATPPFAVLPDPFSLFLGRSDRFEAPAPGNELEPYPFLLGY